MVGFEEKIALEAIKPVGGLINAYLEPKIAKVKAWSKEKELKGQLEPDELAQIMEEYLNKLSIKVNEISTIAFPQKNLKISEAYEPLELQRIQSLSSEDNDDFSFNNIIKGNFSSLILIDGAGMGKSTFSKYIVSQLLYKSDRIPILFELRKINIDGDIIESLVKEFDIPGKLFNRELFCKLLNLGKFFIVVDGFDEVPLDLQEKLSIKLNELSVKSEKNQLILTSRPQDHLPDLVNCSSIKFKPFTIEQTRSLVKRYDAISGLDVGKRLIEQIGKVPDKFIETPLLVSLLYRTFGINNSIADRICTFYDEIYHALYKGHDLVNKNGYAREKKSKLDFEDFRRLLRALCYFMSVSRTTSFKNYITAIEHIEKASKLANITPSSSGNFLDDLMVAVPLMVRDGLEIKFSHKTILEYFTAEYLVAHKNSIEKVEQIFSSKYCKSFDKVFEFLFDLSPNLYHSVITNHWANITCDIDSEKEFNELVLITLSKIKNCKIGIWEADKYYLGKSRQLSRPPNPFGMVANSTTYQKIKFNEKDYFIALAVSDIDSKFHLNAYHALTNEIANPTKFSELSTDKELETLLQFVTVNEWLVLTDELIQIVKNINMFINYSYEYLIEISSNIPTKCYVFNSLKAKNIIKEINISAELDEEMNDLLS